MLAGAVQKLPSTQLSGPFRSKSIYRLSSLHSRSDKTICRQTSKFPSESFGFILGEGGPVLYDWAEGIHGSFWGLVGLPERHFIGGL